MRTLMLIIVGVCSVLAQTGPSRTQAPAAEEMTTTETKILLELNQLKRDFLQHATEFQAWRIAGLEEQIQNLQTTRRELEERVRVLSQGASEWQNEIIRANAAGINEAPILSASPIEEELEKVRQTLREAAIRSDAIGEQLRQARARLEQYNVQAHRIEAAFGVRAER